MSGTATHRQAPTVDAWTNFVHDGITYDLSHLKASTVTFKRTRADLPTERYLVQVTFAHHCFTKGLPALDAPYDRKLRYDYLEEQRLFDVRRWRLSHQLPDLIQSLETRKCLQTGKGNFLSINLIDDQGLEVKYEIYFRTWKPGRGRIYLHVESAYVRDPLDPTVPGVGASRPKQATQIAFMTVLHNTLNGKQIHT